MASVITANWFIQLITDCITLNEVCSPSQTHRVILLRLHILLPARYSADSGVVGLAFLCTGPLSPFNGLAGLFVTIPWLSKLT